MTCVVCSVRSVQMFFCGDEVTKDRQGQLDLPLADRSAARAGEEGPTETGLVADVAVDSPLDRLYSYHVPDELADRLRPGMLVQVPMGKADRKYRGVCLTISTQTYTTSLKPIIDILDERVFFNDKLIALGRWLAEYYVCPPGLAFAAMLPSAVTATKRPRKVRPYIKELPQVEPTFALNRHQREALERINQAIQAGSFRIILLHGVTASGKTELYIRAIKHVLAAGRSAIYLVPEIALTTQMIHRLAERFDSVAILHSGLTPARRRATWQAVAAGQVKVVIGTRSAIFAPTSDLGLIVVDEEQEPSFKNLQSPRYNTRDLAIKRAQVENVAIILGSATPALESYHNSRSNPYWQYLSLPERVAELPMPTVALVDMQQEIFERRGVHLLSRLLEAKITETLSAKRQVILLLNRRGYASYVFCPRCKFVLVCPNCKINLVYHRSSDRAICHRCSTKMIVPEFCDRCGGRINKFGLGTQRVQEELDRKFPQARIARMDTDAMSRPADYEAALGDFAAGNTDILLGTQMIAKGLDFPNVALVGVVCADLALSLPDFRASERTFHLLAQVAGRAGRADHAGAVVVQSYNLSDPAIQSALRHDYDRFARNELRVRRKLSLPPFSRLTRIVIQDAKITRTQQIASELVNNLQELAEKSYRDVAVFGPNPAVISRLRGKYRYQILIKAQSADRMKEFLNQARSERVLNLTMRQIVVDVDPVDLL